MGFCVYFHRTWTPGFNSEYIDPNLAYSFQRRLGLVKKVAWWVFILTLLACVITLLVKLHGNRPSPPCGRKNGSDSTRLSDATAELHLQSPEQDKKGEVLLTAAPTTFGTTPLGSPLDTLHDPQEQPLQSTPIPLIPAHHKNESGWWGESHLKEYLEEQEPGLVKRNLTTRADTTPCHFKCTSTEKCIGLNQKCDGRLDCAGDGLSMDRSDEMDCQCQPDSFICDRNVEKGRECIHMSLVCDSLEDCSNGRDEEICTAVSESLTKVSTINKRRKELKGYVLVRVRGSWHPYCSLDWSPSLGAKICLFFNFKTLVELQTIELTDLNRRIGVHLTGRSKSSEEEFVSVEKSKLLVLNGTEDYLAVTGGPITDVVTHALEDECTVGHIYCAN